MVSMSTASVTPSTADIDLDLVVAEHDGMVGDYKNTGTSTGDPSASASRALL